MVFVCGSEIFFRPLCGPDYFFDIGLIPENILIFFSNGQNVSQNIFFTPADAGLIIIFFGQKSEPEFFPQKSQAAPRKSNGPCHIHDIGSIYVPMESWWNIKFLELPNCKCGKFNILTYESLFLLG